MKVKVKMLRTVHGQDNNDEGAHVPAKRYVEDNEYEVHEDLADAFMRLRDAKGQPCPACEIVGDVVPKKMKKKDLKGAPENK